LVNDCKIPRQPDFKRKFELGGATPSPIVAAFGLTAADTMPYKRSRSSNPKLEGMHVRIFASLILVSKRIAGGG
jgi:hypothetical protein